MKKDTKIIKAISKVVKSLKENKVKVLSDVVVVDVKNKVIHKFSRKNKSKL